MEQSERNPDQDTDRGRAPGQPGTGRADKLPQPSRHHPKEEKGRDQPPEDAPRDPNDPWMGGG
jgi:hypothetical protein